MPGSLYQTGCLVLLPATRMWGKIADAVMRYRMVLFGLIAVLTVVSGLLAVFRLDLNQNFPDNLIPPDDPDYIQYDRLRKVFGADNNSCVYALEAPDSVRARATWHSPVFLNGLRALSDSLKALPGVKNILNLTTLNDLQADDSLRAFRSVPLWQAPLTTPAQADSLLNRLDSLPFLSPTLFNASRTTTLVLLLIDDQALKTRRKHEILAAVEAPIRRFAQAHSLTLHTAGITVIRSYMTRQLPKELALFVSASLLLTALTLYVFYRSRYAVVFPLLLLTASAVFTLGILCAFGFKLTILAAMLPPIIIILGIPPSIYMISDYHQEYLACGDKAEAIRRMLRRLGLVTFMINANTAFGFLTLYFTDIGLLREFGLVAFWGTLANYALTIILLPGCLSLLPPPDKQNLQYLDDRWAQRIVRFMARWVTHRSTWVYGLTGVLLVASVAGMLRLKAVSYMLDDLPTHSPITYDLHYMESQFNGMMPFEIVLDGGRPGAFQKLSNIQKLERLQQRLAAFPELSRTVSLADVIKWSRQAIAGGSPQDYALPTRNEMDLISLYLANTRSRAGADTTRPARSNNPLTALVDSTFRLARINCYVQDIGSERMPALMASVRTEIDSVFTTTGTNGQRTVEPILTGSTHIFLRVNDFLLDNLTWSLVAIFILVGLQMLLLFGSVRIMLVAMLPNILPLALTAGAMGFLGLPLKPSTVLIYELAFGIAVDHSIHFLSEYRRRRQLGEPVRVATLETLHETGSVIIYTSIVLFSGFSIFIFSEFGSTQALGILTSITLAVAMFSNLLLMPLLLLWLDSDPSARTEAPRPEKEH
jgi:predicted RND superfamily exporter protein